MRPPSRPAIAVGIVCAVTAIACFVAAALGPPGGRGSWLTALAGDWTVRLGDDHEIGNDPQRGGTCTVYRVVPVTSDTGESQFRLQTEVEGVLQYAADERHIVLRTVEGYAWRDIEEGDGWHRATQVPDELTWLEASLKTPRASNGIWFVILGVGFICVGLYVLLHGPGRRWLV